MLCRGASIVSRRRHLSWGWPTWTWLGYPNKVVVPDVPFAPPVDLDVALQCAGPLIDASALSHQMSNLSLVIPEAVSHSYVTAALWNTDLLDLGFLNALAYINPLTYMVDASTLCGVPLPIGLLAITGALRGMASAKRMTAMPEAYKDQIISSLTQKLNTMQEYYQLTLKTTNVGYLPTPKSLQLDVQTDYRNFTNFSKNFKKQTGVDMNASLAKMHKDPLYMQKKSMRAHVGTMAFFVCASQEIRSTMRLNIEGLDTGLLWIPNLLEYDFNTALIGCSICSVAFVSSSALDLALSKQTRKVWKKQTLGQKVRPFTLGLGLPMIMLLPICCLEMAPIFQYSFVIGCVVNKSYEGIMNNNLFGLATKYNFKRKEVLMQEFSEAMNKVPEYKRIFDQRKFNKEVLGSGESTKRKTFLQSFREYRSKGYSPLYSVASAALGKETGSVQEMQQNYEDIALEYLYPYDIRLSNYYEDKSERLLELRDWQQQRTREAVQNERAMWKRRHASEESGELDEEYDEKESELFDSDNNFIKQEKSGFIARYEEQQLENILREEESKSYYPWYIRHELAMQGLPTDKSSYR